MSWEQQQQQQDLPLCCVVVRTAAYLSLPSRLIAERSRIRLRLAAAVLFPLLCPYRPRPLSMACPPSLSLTHSLPLSISHQPRRGLESPHYPPLAQSLVKGGHRLYARCRMIPPLSSLRVTCAPPCYALCSSAKVESRYISLGFGGANLLPARAPRSIHPLRVCACACPARTLKRGPNPPFKSSGPRRVLAILSVWCQR